MFHGTNDEQIGGDFLQKAIRFRRCIKFEKKFSRRCINARRSVRFIKRKTVRLRSFIKSEQSVAPRCAMRFMHDEDYPLGSLATRRAAADV